MLEKMRGENRADVGSPVVRIILAIAPRMRRKFHFASAGPFPPVETVGDIAPISYSPNETMDDAAGIRVAPDMPGQPDAGRGPSARTTSPEGRRYNSQQIADIIEN